MKHYKLLFSLTFVLLNLSLHSQPDSTAEQVNKVACVGNSITYGAGIVHRDKNSYPAQLQRMLGAQYQVQNFGVSATTLLSKGNNPYIATPQYKASLDYLPQIVIIKLGTNDTKPGNRELIQDQYQKDYQALIDSYRQLPSKPRVILLKPVICFAKDNAFGESNITYEQQLIPIIEQLAYQNSLEVIDMYHLFDSTYNAALMPDRLHPSSLGATLMAERIATQVLRQGDKTPALDLPFDGQFNFHGYQGFTLGNNKAVYPKQAAPGNPWVIRARFWGHQPQTDIALLEQGFFITYCDVADLYGSPQALQRYDDFYRLMTSKGLSQKVVLEGMSRGGLIVFNWAAANQDKVAAIYADAPVLDFKSWPLGLGKSNGSKADTDKLLKAYGFKDIEEAKRWKGNPIDHTDKLTQMPILLVVGDTDSIVPIAENSTLFENTLQHIKVIHKKNTGHHPHSLFNPQPIVKFILESTGYWQNPCIKPVAGSEYRSGAGWKEGADWHAVAEEINDVLKNNKVDVLLIGNSITQGIGSNRRQAITSHAGRNVMNNVGVNWENAGISGDRTQHVLWRLQTGDYQNSTPKAVFITIGVNNLLGGDSGEEVAEGIIAVVEEAAKKFPQATIYTFGLLPVGRYQQDRARKEHDVVHQLLAQQPFPTNVQYLNLQQHFTLSDGQLDTSLYSKDCIHLTDQGYQKFIGIIANLLKDTIKKQ